MSDNEYNFDNFLSDATETSKTKEKQQKDKRPQSKENLKGKESASNQTTSVRIKARKGTTTPFAVQLHERDQEIIRAVCDAEGITQKHFFQYLIDEFMKGKKDQIRLAIKSYRAKNHENNKDSLLD